jgi:hypothetical protein
MLIEDFKEIEGSIEYVRRMNCEILNDYHKVNYSKEYWWIVAGFFPLLVFRLIQIKKSHNIPIGFIVRHGSLDENIFNDARLRVQELVLFLQNSGFEINKIKGDDKSLIYKTHESYISLNQEEIPLIVKLPNFIFRDTLIRVYVKLKNKLYKKKRALFIKKSKNEFEWLYFNLAPIMILELYPVGLEWIINKTKLKNLNTYLGFELNIAQKIHIAKSKESGTCINVLAHGFPPELSLDIIYFKSISKNKIPFMGDYLRVQKHQKIETNKILVIAPSSIYDYINFMDLNSFKEFISDYEEIINFLKIFNNLEIYIRFKNDRPILYKFEESLNVELRAFEKCYQEYALIICPNVSTIVAKCIYNQIDYICYDRNHRLRENVFSNYVNSQDKIFNNLNSFKKIIEEKLSYQKK